MNAPVTASDPWVTTNYCSDCHDRHPGPCGCWCHRPAAPAARNWRTFAACLGADPDLFFPAAAPGTPAWHAQAVEALTWCTGCLVRTECLADTPAGDVHGIRGGTTPYEREAARLSLAGRTT